ncbi:hypothetical protein [Citrobacter sp.]|uniref:hypothetical protein n=1 Tax=Citrobacter sp. TaxID=1896336 RepID=UPI002FC754DA
MLTINHIAKGVFCLIPGIGKDFSFMVFEHDYYRKTMKAIRYKIVPGSLEFDGVASFDLEKNGDEMAIPMENPIKVEL